MYLVLHWKATIHGMQGYLSFPLVWLVMETDREDVDEVEKEEDVLWLNSNSLGTTDTCGDDKEEVEARGSMHPRQDW